MSTILEGISNASSNGQKLLAVLIDPDKFNPEATADFIANLPANCSHLFVGGSTVTSGITQRLVVTLKANTTLPVVLFPGDVSQLCEQVDALLYLSLLSGDNPEYLVGQQLKAIDFLEQHPLEVIPTGYLLIDGQSQSAVARVTNTQPLSQQQPKTIIQTAQMAQLLGKKLIYLEAGSGAKVPVNPDIIRQVKQKVTTPIIVGGGIRSEEQLQAAYQAGADLVVMGTAFESSKN